MKIRFDIPRTPWPWHRGLLFGLACALAAWGARLVLSPLLQADTPFITFFVAVLAAAAWGGWVGGLSAAVGSALVASYAFIGGPGFEVDGGHLGALVVFLLVCALLVTIAEALRGALRREAEAAAQLTVVSREMQHRVKNLLSVVQALVQLTGGSAASVPAFKAALADRLGALARAQALVLDAPRLSAPLALIAREILAPFGLDDRIDITPCEPDAVVASGQVVTLALLLNELATNAVKHGALSAPEGRVALGWTVGEDGKVVIDWREQGGPPVSAPVATGFGTRLFKGALPPAQGSVTVDYAADGVRCRVVLG